MLNSKPHLIPHSAPWLSSSLRPSSFIIFYLLTPDEDTLLKALVLNRSLCVIEASTFP